MKNNEKIRCYRKICGPLLIVLFVGMGGLFLPRSSAEENNGKGNAKDSVVAAKRDPFWPIGYTPRKVVNSTGTGTTSTVARKPGSIDWEEAMKRVVINGVSSRATDEYVAVINNEVKSVGEIVSVLYGGAKYTWKVEKITPPGSVKLRRHLVE